MYICDANQKYIRMPKNNIDKDKIQEYLDKLTTDDLLTIIKYGLRGSDAPLGVTVEDIYYLIQSNPL